MKDQERKATGKQKQLPCGGTSTRLPVDFFQKAYPPGERAKDKLTGLKENSSQWRSTPSAELSFSTEDRHSPTKALGPLYYQPCLTRTTPGSPWSPRERKGHKKSNKKLYETIKLTSQGKYTVKFRIRNWAYKLFMPLAQTLKDKTKQTKCSNNSWDIIIRQAFKMWGSEVKCQSVVLFCYHLS